MNNNKIDLGVSDGLLNKWEKEFEKREKESKYFDNPFKGLNKDQRKAYIFSKLRHQANQDTFNIVTFLPRMLFKTSKKIIEKITYSKVREELEKENKRLKMVIESKERARIAMEMMKYENYFTQINFKDKLGNFPMFINLEVNGDKETFTFKSYIPLDDWVSKKEELETVFNTNIIDVRQLNEDKQTVYLDTTKKDIPAFIPWSNEYLLDKLVINLGQTALNNVTIDLESWTSGIIAGSIGSGKSVTLMGILIQLLLKRQLLDVPIEFILFDGKGGLDLQDFAKYGQFTIDLEEFNGMLNDVWKEYERRKELFFDENVKKLSKYNEKHPSKKLPDIFIVIDEISVITDTQGMETEEKAIRKVMTKKLADLARLGRALGIHILIGIQVPNMQTVPGQIKNVLDLRISGFLKDESASRIVLNNNLANKIPHIKGRMVLDTVEYQSYFFDTDILETIKPLEIAKTETITKSKTIELDKKRKQTAKKDSNGTIEADIGLTHE